MNGRAHAAVAGVIGWPVAHSQSPILHGFWFREHGVDGVYVPLAVQPHDFSVAVRGLMASGFAGVNVTVPHKQAAFALAHTWDEAAGRAGVANLLSFHDGRIEARNTDVGGLVASLTEALDPDTLAGKNVIILGAGGAAHAAVLACTELSAGKIAVLNRTGARAETLARNLARSLSTPVAAGGLDDWGNFAPLAGLVINATSAGMAGAPSMQLTLELLPAGAAVCDLVYNPLETPLLAHARRHGIKAIDGLGMLMHQAVPAFEAFYGVRPKVTPALRKELEWALGR